MDTRGRVQVSVERREALLAEFEKSGMSAKKFALFVGLKHQTFAAWVTRRRKERQIQQQQPSTKTSLSIPSPASHPKPVSQQPLPALQWMEAVVEEKNALSPSLAEKHQPLSVYLPGGARLEISHARQVGMAAELLRALASSRQLSSC